MFRKCLFVCFKLIFFFPTGNVVRDTFCSFTAVSKTLFQFCEYLIKIGKVWAFFTFLPPKKLSYFDIVIIFPLLFLLSLIARSPSFSLSLSLHCILALNLPLEVSRIIKWGSLFWFNLGWGRSFFSSLKRTHHLNWDEDFIYCSHIQELVP